ncbi:MAG TPA: glycosyltransferase, partial [Candidatus Gastranaerophilaceae bacterium]|nr:glycosyltransferase [Candidatus Gastranaerophilaceae bacterium]
MELILNLLYFYVAVYSVYFFVASIKNLSDKKFAIQQKYSGINAQSELCVIVYSHNNEITLQNLVKQLKSQDYPIDKFSVYVILDNCSDNSEKLFINESFIKVFNIADQDTVGKDQAISILLEKLSTVQNFNAYVFLDASRYIDEHFLSSVNASLTDEPVVSGSTVLVSEYPSFKDKVKISFHKYYTNFIQKSRSILGLASIIDSDILIMRQEIIEKIGCVDFQSINSELKYSLLLSKVGLPCSFNPNIKTYIGVEDFNLRIPSISARLNLFKNCFTQLWTKNFVFIEHVFSLLTPNVLLLTFIYLYLLKHSFKYYFIVDFSVVLLSFIMLILGFSLSLINSKLNREEMLYLFLYPFYSLGHIIKNLKLVKRIKSKITGKDEVFVNTEKLVTDVLVTDGKSNI